LIVGGINDGGFKGLGRRGRLLAGGLSAEGDQQTLGRVRINQKGGMHVRIPDRGGFDMALSEAE